MSTNTLSPRPVPLSNLTIEIVDSSTSLTQTVLFESTAGSDLGVHRAKERGKLSWEESRKLWEKLSSYTNRLDKRVIEHIKGLANQGVVNVSEVQRRSRHFSEGICPPDTDPVDRRYFPERREVYNHIYNSLADTRGDQVKISECVHKWQEDAAERDRIFFRPMSDTEPLLFVYQTSFQRYLLHKYGKEICLLDSTYKTTKYTVPLSFVCILTNVGYQVVAAFVVGKETTKNIAEALEKVSEWNPSWKPENWLTDFDQREISAIEKVFKGTNVLLCDFHREQSWQRWLGSKKNGVANKKDMILKQLRTIAHSRDEENFREEVDILRNSDVYKTESTFRNWFDKQWLQDCKRWVYCFRKHLFLISVNTTNGVERQHRLLKESYLKENGFGGTLTSLLTILVKKYFPEMQERYLKNNAQALEICKSYSVNIPEFLKERPATFLKHCLNRMAPKVNHIEKHEVMKNQDEQTLAFTVCGYTVSYDHVIPMCTCPDFERHHWPCKHILSIFIHFPEHGWDSLNTLYTSQPVFNIDKDILAGSELEINFEERETECVQESAENVSPNEKLDPVSLRKSCIEILKNIENNIYGTNSVNILLRMKAHLIDIDEFLDKEAVKISGIPSRLKTSKRKLKKPFKQSKKRPRVAETTTWDEKTILAENTTAEEKSILEDRLRPELSPFFEEIDRVWKKRSAKQDQIGKIGPYTLTSESIKFLQTTLSDEVIDSYLYLLCMSKNILHINCVVMTAIFTGAREIHSLLQQENVLGYNFCIGAVNEGGNHWVLMIILPTERKILYLNPLGEREIKEQQLLLRWYNFLQARYAARFEDKIEEWSIMSPEHAKQMDSISCGVYVLELAERYINGWCLKFTWSKAKVTNVRRMIAAHLLHAAATPSETMTCDEVMEEVTICPQETTRECNIEQEPELKEVIHKDRIEPKETATQRGKRKVKCTSVKGKKEKNLEISTIIDKRIVKPKIRESFNYECNSRKRYCVCKKRSEGLYWACDRCNNWFHPDCIGRDSNEAIPKKNTIFYCDNCLVTVVAAWPVISQPFVDDENEHTTHFVCMEDVKILMSTAYSRCYNITHAEGTKSNVLWLQRHYDFVDKKSAQLSYGFGEGVFSQFALATIQSSLENTFLRRKNEKAVYSLHCVIWQMANDELREEFEKEIGLAEHYLERVLKKEAMVAVLQQMTGYDYGKCNKELEKTESKNMIEGLKLVYEYKRSTAKED